MLDVYVDGAKIAAHGLLVRKGLCYHGLALNLDMDLAPFLVIDPCGYGGMPVMCVRDLGIEPSPAVDGDALLDTLLAFLAERVGRPA